MRDNKIRLSTDVLEKASQIAAEWGLKNSRAAVEAVFRRYADEYLYGRYTTASQTTLALPSDSTRVPDPIASGALHPGILATRTHSSPSSPPPNPIWEDAAAAVKTCEALDALDDLLGA